MPVRFVQARLGLGGTFVQWQSSRNYKERNDLKQMPLRFHSRGCSGSSGKHLFRCFFSSVANRLASAEAGRAARPFGSLGLLIFVGSLQKLKQKGPKLALLRSRAMTRCPMFCFFPFSTLFASLPNLDLYL